MKKYKLKQYKLPFFVLTLLPQVLKRKVLKSKANLFIGIVKVVLYSTQIKSTNTSCS